MDKRKFQELVAQAVESSPEEFLERMENVAIVVEDSPTPEQLATARVSSNETLLGLYEGIPLTGRNSGYSGVLPDKITIFQRPIEAANHSDSAVAAAIGRVLRHEIAHHFGIDDERLKEMGR